jgi:ParB family chromosome partitioning protein
MAEAVSRSVPARICPHLKDIPISDIKIKENVRKKYTGIDDLADSIRQYGLQHPITVYCIQNEGYIVKIGHRRLMAYHKLHTEAPEQFRTIPCFVSDANNTAVIQLVENVQRVDLSSKELYEALSALRNQGMILKDIAAVMGKTEKTVKNLFVGINEIERDKDLLNFLDSPAGGTIIQDIADSKGITDKKERFNLLEQRKTGAITRAELRQQIKDLKQTDKATADNRPQLRFTVSLTEIKITEADYIICNRL